MPIQKSAFISYRAKFQSKKRLLKGVFFDADSTKGIATICLMDLSGSSSREFFSIADSPECRSKCSGVSFNTANGDRSKELFRTSASGISSLSIPRY